MTDMKIQWRFFLEEKIIDFAEIWTADLIHNLSDDDLDRSTTVADTFKMLEIFLKKLNVSIFFPPKETILRMLKPIWNDLLRLVHMTK